MSGETHDSLHLYKCDGTFEVVGYRNSVLPPLSDTAYEGVRKPITHAVMVCGRCLQEHTVQIDDQPQQPKKKWRPTWWGSGQNEAVPL